MERNTQQRQAILKVFEKVSRPLSVNEVLDLAKRRCRGIGIATVYRNLKALVEEGKVLSLDMRGLTIDRGDYLHGVKSATNHYLSESNKVFICTDKACASRRTFEPTQDCLRSLSEAIGCHVEVTGCHWQCDHPPVMTLKYGDRSRQYLNCDTETRCAEVFDSMRELVRIEQSEQIKETEERGDKMLDWIIVGGGIHGTYISNCLVKSQGVDPEKLVVVDPHDAPLSVWKRCTKNTCFISSIHTATMSLQKAI
jgi:Fe2+ or Zn2+ uptake regulation protein